MPDVSPLRHRRPRDREWKCTSPVARVAASASASSQPTISTRPSATSWTTPATRPSCPRRRVRVETRGDVDRPGADGHAAAPAGAARTGSPAAAIAALTSAIETSRRWKIAGGEDGVGAALADRGHEVGRARGAARGDDRDAGPAR